MFLTLAPWLWSTLYIMIVYHLWINYFKMTKNIFKGMKESGKPPLTRSRYALCWRTGWSCAKFSSGDSLSAYPLPNLWEWSPENTYLPTKWRWHSLRQFLSYNKLNEKFNHIFNVLYFMCYFFPVKWILDPLLFTNAYFTVQFGTMIVTIRNRVALEQ